MSLILLTLSQGFRKYLTQSKDHEELLSFLLGGMIKDKVRMHQIQRHELPEKVVVKLADLEEKVQFFSSTIWIYVHDQTSGKGT